MTFELPWPPKLLSPNARAHWAVIMKAKKAYRTECAWRARAQGAQAIEADHISASFVFYPPSKRRIDLDNCIARMKAGIDGIADVIGVDDSKWRMSFAFADSIGGKVVVKIEKSTKPRKGNGSERRK